MRIGITTFWESNNNYGQILQCFALQNILAKLGYESELIRYHSNHMNIVRRIMKKISNIIANKGLSNKDKIDRDFVGFRNRYISLSKNEYYGFDDILNHPPVYDAYICGSDQVWSMKPNQKDNLYYYLAFVPKGKKKIAFSVSFGLSIYPSGLRKYLQNQIKDFNHISVREEDGVLILKGLGKESTCVLDPTILLSKQEYIFLFEKSFCLRDYTFVYHINVKSPKDLYWEEIIKFMPSQNFVSVTSEGRMPSLEILPETKYVYPTVGEWMQYICFSNFVITTSFHGAVFCIIFKKDFISIPLTGEHADSNNRIYELLDKLGLRDRIASKSSDIERIVNSKINWKDVDEKIKYYKEVSLNFLKMSLN